MQRLFRSTISFEQSQQDGQKSGKKMAGHADRPAGRAMVGPGFARAARPMGKLGRAGRGVPRGDHRAPVPVDLRALRALKKSPLALDLYAWATYKTYSVNRSGKEAQHVPWRSLQKQLGCDYSNPRHFKAAAKIAIRKVQVGVSRLPRGRVPGRPRRRPDR